MKIQKLLLLDAATCALMALLLLLGASALSELLNLPRPLLFWAGVLLCSIALFMYVLSRQGRPSRVGVWLVIVGNIAWVIASLAVLFYTSPNGLGLAFVVAQAAVVAVLATAEWFATDDHA